MYMDKHGEILAKWNFQEFTQYERSKKWYFWIFVLIAFCLIYSIVTINFLFAVIIIIGTITFVLINRREPEQITFSITEDGIEVEDRYFPFEEISNFYIIYQPPEVKTLFINFKSATRPRMPIPLENQNPLDIRKLLTEYLEEDLDKEDEPISEGLSRWLKL
ncbi:hypothetical protein HOD65_04210 [bacterium]|nr:hypothetical protein [bacterium]